MGLPEQFKDLGSVARQEGYSNSTGAAAEKWLCLLSGLSFTVYSYAGGLCVLTCCTCLTSICKSLFCP